MNKRYRLTPDEAEILFRYIKRDSKGGRRCRKIKAGAKKEGVRK